jgi:hypothetical protein
MAMVGGSAVTYKETNAVFMAKMPGIRSTILKKNVNIVGEYGKEKR